MASKLLVTVPDTKDPLLLYVAAFDHAVSGVLVREKEEGSKVIQHPVYYILEALSRAKLNYMKIKKNCIWKLKNYFQAHEIIVFSSQPHGDVFNNKEAFGRIEK
jgi:hypothetical protein